MALPLSVERIKRTSRVPAFASVPALIAQWQPVEPVYVLHPDAFALSSEAFIKGFPGETMYAVKANDTPPVLDALWASGIRHFDVASLHEVRLIRSRYPGARMSFMAPIRLNGAAAEAFHVHGVRAFAVDSAFELQRLLHETGLERSPSAARELTVLVRLAVKSHSSALELSSKFGVDPQQGAELLKAVAQTGAKPALTFHVGSLCTSPEDYRRALALCAQTIQLSGVAVCAIDVGGGFPAHYLEIEAPPLQAFFDGIRAAQAELGLADIPLLCEPGRALVADGVSVLTQVTFRRGQALYINDGVYGSLSEFNIPNWPARYPLTVYRRDKFGAISVQAGTGQPFRIYGPTCDTLDKLPVDLTLPDHVQAGDWILFEQMGAYSAAVRTAFNGYYPDTFASAPRPQV
ncbi:MAG TPA: hypothetical protein DCL54_00465 [Alphaproteobacteria bacterium]|nr:hypothetical protein [Alphaproteobacteria bacterium]HAJ45039.1 hypothetical protein [Alphaproteobacteria bacterium]